MNTNNETAEEEKFEFTVTRITIIQNLLGRADKKVVNKFINDIRNNVYLYHQHQRDLIKYPESQDRDLYFTQLNDKAHQLARFTTEFSLLVKDAPEELLEKAKSADRAIDRIHSDLVKICLTIDDLLLEKERFIIDIDMLVKTTYDAYCKRFNIKPNGRYYVHESDIPVKGPLEDLLVPVVQILTNRNLDRCYKLVQKIIT
ncbi:MAG: hypothetical protein GY808_07445 [Gammaproteobacteria bacterium]|nr:hypothetical protein [Gammaproteobacteria bacterium]